MPMTINPLNIIQGPADVYIAPFGTAEPADSAATVVAGPPPAPWVGIGGTEIGVTIEIDMTYVDVTVNQLIDPVGARPTARKITAKTQMKEGTVANFQAALNNLNTVSYNAAYTTVDPLTTSSAFQATYVAIIVDGWAPTLSSGLPARRRWILRKCICNLPKVMEDYELAKAAVLDVTFGLYYVSAGVPLFHRIDQTA